MTRREKIVIIVNTMFAGASVAAIIGLIIMWWMI